MYFMLDENVPQDVADMLIGQGHKAEFIRSGATALVVAMADAGICPGRDVQLCDNRRQGGEYSPLRR